MSLENLHDRVVLGVAALVLRDRDPLIRKYSVCCRRCRTTTSFVDSRALQSCADPKRLLGEHMSKALHSVFFKHVEK
jgi:hypothetical protein